MNVPVQTPSPILPEVADELDRFIALRRQFHQNPELPTQEKETASRIAEATNLPHARRNTGVMDARGNDGHIAILLAERSLAEGRGSDDG